MCMKPYFWSWRTRWHRGRNFITPPQVAHRHLPQLLEILRPTGIRVLRVVDSDILRPFLSSYERVSTSLFCLSQRDWPQYFRTIPTLLSIRSETLHSPYVSEPYVIRGGILGYQKWLRGAVSSMAPTDMEEATGGLTWYIWIIKKTS